MKEEDRQRAIRLRLARSEDRSRGALSTGLPVLDAALVGGLPRGTLVELFGPSSSGKTTLALQIVTHVQRNGATAAWIDAEHAFDAPYAVGLGVQLDAMPLAQPESAEQALEIAGTLAESSAVELVVMDSAAALVPRLELESAMGDSGGGLQTRVLASGLRRLTTIAAKSGACVVFLNQTRARRSDEEISAGGAPLKLHAAVRIALAAQQGGRVRFRVLKNKAAAAFRDGELHCTPGGEFTKSP